MNVEAVKKKKYSRDYISDGIMTFFYNCQCLTMMCMLFVESYASAVSVLNEYLFMYL